LFVEPFDTCKKVMSDTWLLGHVYTTSPLAPPEVADKFFALEKYLAVARFAITFSFYL